MLLSIFVRNIWYFNMICSKRFCYGRTIQSYDPQIKRRYEPEKEEIRHTKPGHDTSGIKHQFLEENISMQKLILKFLDHSLQTDY